MSAHTQPQPPSRPGKQSVTNAVIDDLTERRLSGIVKYRTELQTFNGRRALVDLYQELLDAALYMKQRLMEEDAAESAD